jgi:hypothetical protein
MKAADSSNIQVQAPKQQPFFQSSGGKTPYHLAAASENLPISSISIRATRPADFRTTGVSGLPTSASFIPIKP